MLLYHFNLGFALLSEHSEAEVHVPGVGPANCHVKGRVIMRKRDALVMLQPGESRFYELELELTCQGEVPS